MPNLSRLAPAAILAVGCVLISGVREQKRVKARMPMHALAIEVPGYGSTRDTVISADERRIAGMSDYVMRFFHRDANDPGFSVYVGYYEYQVQGKSIHSPKNCLPGAGWEALEASVQPVQVGGRTYAVNRYLLQNQGQQALVYYWYQGRGRVAHDEYRVKYELLRDAALYGRTEEALVRIVVPVPGEMAAADSLASSVAVPLVAEVGRVLPAFP